MSQNTLMRVAFAMLLTSVTGCDSCALFRSVDVEFDSGLPALEVGSEDVALFDTATPVDASATPDLGAVDLVQFDLGLPDPSDMTTADIQDLGADMPAAPSLPGCAPAPVTPQPDRKIGDGTPGSCTETELLTALAAGGRIAFDCGDATHRIQISNEIAVDVDTTLIGGGRIVLDGQGATAMFRIEAPSSSASPHLQLFGMEISGGQKRISNSDDCGAAVYRFGGTLTVVNSHIHDNGCTATGSLTPFGGAIAAVRGGGLYVYDSIIENNTAMGGGGIYASNTQTSVVRTVVRNNTSVALSAGGIGIFEQGPFEICGSTITDNTAAKWGGGMFYDDDNPPASSLVISQTVFARNSAGNDGGGADLEDTILTVEYSTFVDNTAGTGGALWLGGDSGYEITNSTFLRNQATVSGGAIFATSSSGEVNSVTFAKNVSGDVGAALANFLSGGPLSVGNTVFVNNTGLKTCSAIFAGQNNLHYPGEPTLCTSAAIVADPTLDLPTEFGAGEVVIPPPNSAAVGQGVSCPTLDQRGVVRPDPCTLGAFEPSN